MKAVNNDKEEPVLKARFMRNSGLWALTVFLLGAMTALMSACGGGDEQVVAPPPSGSQIGVAPIIISITPKSASPGDSITIAGLNFESEQNGSTVVLNGLALTVTSWSDQEIVATLPSAATSGIIIVTVNGRLSHAGDNAKIYIGSPPEPGAPMVTGLSQASGVWGDEIIVYGLNFQFPRPDNSRVFFTGGTGEIEAEVVPLEGETEGYQWLNTSVRVVVPNNAVTGPVVVVVAGVRSNDNFVFQVEGEPPPPLNQPPIITGFSPTQGIVGTIVHIEGDYFGNSRGSSVVQVGTLNMDVVLWSNHSIYAAVPEGATSNRIRVIARGHPVESVNPFRVLLQPEITAVIPNELRVGEPLTIHGRNFSTEGSIHFTPYDPEDTGQQTTAVTSSQACVSSWSDTLISLNRLPPLNSDAGIPVDVTVKTDYPEDSNAVRVDVVSDMVATLKVKALLEPTPGETVEVEQSVGVAGETTFKFFGGAGGGSGTYKFVFDFGDGHSTTADNVAAVSETTHSYSAAGSYQPFLRVVDGKQARVTFQGPEMTIVPVGEPVITGIHVAKLAVNKDDAEFKPNDYVGKYFGKLLGNVYNFDETFVPVVKYSPIGLEGLQYSVRKYFLSVGEYTGRPIAYRVEGGSNVNVCGFNLGGAGALYLAADVDVPFKVPDNLVFSRTDTDEMWKFTLPSLPMTSSFNGLVQIQPLDLPPVTSSTPLVAQPVPLAVTPTPTPPNRVDYVTIAFNDLFPPDGAGDFLGSDAYMFVAFPATDVIAGTDYLLPGTDHPDIYLLPFAIPAVFSEEQHTVMFHMGSITNGTYRMNVGGTEYQGWPARNPDSLTNPDALPLTLVQAKTGVGTKWFAFVWTGVRTHAGAIDTFANSGIISTTVEITLGPPE
ncbi:MAG: hypothetical protein B1H03_04590 [Planctomycetales bacterium 4484_113]|nr:MAG: hypothetical protein B1H03_04590 [Planctomycetales bacterium 4484_113]